MTAIPPETDAEFDTRLTAMTDDALIQAFHKACEASRGGGGSVYRQRALAQVAMIRRFGLHEYLERYRERYPDR